jgi:hypothetical protein
MVELCFALEKAFLYFYAGLPDHLFLGIKHWVMRTQIFKSCKMTPYEVVLSKSIFPCIQYMYTEMRRIFSYIRRLYSIWISYMQFRPTLLKLCCCTNLIMTALALYLAFTNNTKKLSSSCYIKNLTGLSTQAQAL